MLLKQKHKVNNGLRITGTIWNRQEIITILKKVKEIIMYKKRDRSNRYAILFIYPLFLLYIIIWIHNYYLDFY